MSTLECETATESQERGAPPTTATRSTGSSAAGIPSLPPAAPPRFLTAIIAGLGMIALSVSAYLGWTALTMREVYGCGSGEVFDCGHVLTSRWSKWLGIPVGILAAGMWGSLLAALFFVRRSVPSPIRHWAWRFVTASTYAAALAGLWFIGLQVFLLEHLCLYCLIAHACGLGAAALIIAYRPAGNRWSLGMAGPAVAGLVLLAGVQAMTPPPPTFVVERFDIPDDSASASSDEPAGDNGDSGELFSPPGEVFEPPGELFEPPVASDRDRDTSEGQSEPDQSKSREREPRQSEDSSVASSLLLISPLRWSLRQPLLLEMPVPMVADNPLTDDPVDTRAARGAAADDQSGEADGDQTRDVQEAAEDDEADAGEDPRQNADAEPERLVRVQGNKFTLNSRQWPLIGDPDAPYIFVEMLDYTCPHCRNTHRAVKGACERYRDQLAVIILPVPLERSCNPSASGGGHAGACEIGNLAVAVWRVAPQLFGRYHNWLMEGGRSRTPREARRKAEELVGGEALRDELDTGVAAAYIRRHVELYRRVGAGAVPKLMFPGRTLTGEVSSTSTLCGTIERELVRR